MAVAVAAGGEVAPNVLEPKAAVELVLLLTAAVPKLPNVDVLVCGLPKIGALDVDEPNAGAAAGASEELLLLAPKVNAGEDADSADFEASVAGAPKLNPEVAVALPKTPPVDAAAVFEVAGADGAVAVAPNVPNVGAAAAAPNVGTTLLADWSLLPKTKLDVAGAAVVVVPVLIVMLVAVGFAPKEKVDAAVVTVLVDAVIPVVAGELPTAVPKLKLGVMEGPVGF